MVAAVLFATSAFASVPFPDNCTIAVGSYVCTCPQGDWGYIDVTVRDQFNLPIAGQIAGASLGNTTQLCADPITGITDALGYVRLYLPVGTLSTVNTPRITSTYTVTAMGYTIGGGSFEVMSADYNCSPTVDALDFSFFAQDWLQFGVSLRSDFNDDGTVDALDYSLFALHWLHSN
jgi:hypothetical protein